VGGVEAVRDAEATSAGEDEFEGRWRVGGVGLDVDGEEGDRRGGRPRGAVALPEPFPPGVEGEDGEVLTLADVVDGESAALSPVDQVSPVPFLMRITAFALGHG
jgi:hypothetical protein